MRKRQRPGRTEPATRGEKAKWDEIAVKQTCLQLGYRYKDVPVPRGFAVWPFVARQAYLDRWWNDCAA